MANVSFNSFQSPEYINALKEVDRSATNRSWLIYTTALLFIAGGAALIATHVNEFEMAAIGVGVCVVGGVGGLYGRSRVKWLQNEERKEVVSRVRTPPTPDPLPSRPETPVEKAPLRAPIKPSKKEPSIQDLPSNFDLQNLDLIRSLLKKSPKEFLNFVKVHDSYKNLIVVEMLSESLSRSEFENFLHAYCYKICSVEIRNVNTKQVEIIYQMYACAGQMRENYIDPFVQKLGIDLKTYFKQLLPEIFANLKETPLIKALLKCFKREFGEFMIQNQNWKSEKVVDFIVKQVREESRLQNIETMEGLNAYIEIEKLSEFAHMVTMELEMNDRALSLSQKSLLKKMIEKRLENPLEVEEEDLNKRLQSLKDVR